jgi:hypothetical protein
MAAALALLAPALQGLLTAPGLGRWAALGALVATGLMVFGGVGQTLGAFDARRLRPGLRLDANGL